MWRCLVGSRFRKKANLANGRVPEAKGSRFDWRSDGYLRRREEADCVHGAHDQGWGAENREEISYPLTGLECVDTIVTDLAVIEMLLRRDWRFVRLLQVDRRRSAGFDGGPLIVNGGVPEISLS